MARYPETVAFIEKREKDMRERWAKLECVMLIEGELEEEAYVLMEQLELVSLLLDKKVFDSEIVYKFWWRFFDEPLRRPQINTWIAIRQQDNPTALRHYINRCSIWATRIDSELGRPQASS